jgi:hypothetical protein
MSVKFLKARRAVHDQEIDPRWTDLYVDEERRQHERHAVKLEVKVSASDKRKSEFAETTTTENLSLGGLCFVTDGAVPSEGSIEIAVSTAGSKELLLPDEFLGVGTIVRHHFASDGRTTVGVLLGDSLRHNAEFAVFVTAASHV